MINVQGQYATWRGDSRHRRFRPSYIRSTRGAGRSAGGFAARHERDRGMVRTRAARCWAAPTSGPASGCSGASSAGCAAGLFCWRSPPSSPLTLIALLTFVFSAGLATRLPIAVLDLDSSDLSRSIIRMVDASQDTAVSVHVAELAEGRRLILNGEVHGLLKLPKNLERDVFAGRRPEVVFLLQHPDVDHRQSHTARRERSIADRRRRHPAGAANRAGRALRIRAS